MVTLNELCAALDTSGRFLTERTARDWWTKGLLPRPQRRGLGRGIGTETYWPDRRVVDQAKAANDFLAQHSRTYSAALHLWLSGFPVDLHLVRGAYQRLIGRHLRSMRGPPHDPDGLIGKLATNFARHITKPKLAPQDVRDAVDAFTLPFLLIYFGSAEQFESTGLSDLWARAEPYVSGGKDQAPWLLTDDHLETAALYLGQMASLTAQREAIASATEYEMVRARRVMLLVTWHLRRMSQSLKSDHDAEDLCRPLFIVLGRLAIPILIMILRDERLRRATIPCLLSLAVKIRSHMLPTSSCTVS